MFIITRIIIIWNSATGTICTPTVNPAVKIHRLYAIQVGTHWSETRNPRDTLVRDTSSKGRIFQGTHRPRDTSYKRRIVQGTHRPRDASSNGRIVQGRIVQEKVRGLLGRGYIVMASFSPFPFLLPSLPSPPPPNPSDCLSSTYEGLYVYMVHLNLKF
jgi:hypothetical protein